MKGRVISDHVHRDDRTFVKHAVLLGQLVRVAAADPAEHSGSHVLQPRRLHSRRLLVSGAELRVVVVPAREESLRLADRGVGGKHEVVE